MSRLLRRLRGLLGLGGVGTIAGGLFGGLLSLGATFFGMPNLFGTLTSSVIFLGLFGGVSSIFLGLSIPVLARSDRVSDLSPVVSGLSGLLAGGVAPLVVVAMLRGTIAVPGIGVVAGIAAVLGGLLTGGMVAIAGDAERRELEAGAVSTSELIGSSRQAGSGVR